MVSFLYRRKVTVILIVLLLILLSSVSIYGMSVEGGYVSEKVVSRQGVSNSYLTIDRQGVSSSLVDSGMGIRIETLEPTGVLMGTGGTSALLRGNIVSLNGFGSGDVWFEWGYNGDLGTIVGSQAIASTGEVNFVLTSYNPDRTVYYRFAADSGDGETFGAISSFKVQGSIPTAYRLTQVLEFVWIGLGALFVISLIGFGAPLPVVIITGGVFILLNTIGTQVILSALQSWW